MRRLALVFGPLILCLAGCATTPATPAQVRHDVHLLRLDLEDLGDELVRARPELAQRWEAAKHAADLAGAAWDAWLAGGDRAELELALADALEAGEDLVEDLAGEDSAQAAAFRVLFKVLTRHVLGALAPPAEIPAPAPTDAAASG